MFRERETETREGGACNREAGPRARDLPPARPLTPPLLCPQVPAVCVLRRSPEGAPVQVFLPENGEIISQV